MKPKFIVNCNGTYVKYTSGDAYGTTFTKDKKEAKLYTRKGDAEYRARRVIDLVKQEEGRTYRLFEDHFKPNELDQNNTRVEEICLK